MSSWQSIVSSHYFQFLVRTVPVETKAHLICSSSVLRASVATTLVVVPPGLDTQDILQQ
jgi:hypothetical protein